MGVVSSRVGERARVGSGGERLQRGPPAEHPTLWVLCVPNQRRPRPPLPTVDAVCLSCASGWGGGGGGAGGGAHTTRGRGNGDSTRPSSHTRAHTHPSHTVHPHTRPTPTPSTLHQAGVATPVAAGAAIGMAIAPEIKRWYAGLKKSRLTPPDALFGECVGGGGGMVWWVAVVPREGRGWGRLFFCVPGFVVHGWTDPPTHNKPSLFPPPPPPVSLPSGPVWTVLYTLMGISSVMAAKAGVGTAGLALYGAQLAANLAWSPLFFKAKDMTLASADIAAVVGLAAATHAKFKKVSPDAAKLLVPYIAWSSYATLLTAAFWRDNPAARTGPARARLQSRVRRALGGARRATSPPPAPRATVVDAAPAAAADAGAAAGSAAAAAAKEVEGAASRARAKVTGAAGA